MSDGDDHNAIAAHAVHDLVREALQEDALRAGDVSGARVRHLADARDRSTYLRHERGGRAWVAAFVPLDRVLEFFPSFVEEFRLFRHASR